MITIEELAQKFRFEVFGNKARLGEKITGFNSLAQARAGELSFLNDAKYAEQLQSTQASAVVVARPTESQTNFVQLVAKDPYYGFARAASWLESQSRPAHRGGISPQASISPSAEIDPLATIGPFCTIEDHVKIGKRTVLHAGVYVGRGTTVGDDCDLRAHVVLEHGTRCGNRVIIHAGTVIGADGFGFAPSAEGIAKLPQIGTVVIHDDVEIGAGTTIDRAAFGETIIGRGTKIDSAVHLGHNVQVGEHTMICGAASIAGSVKIGSHVVIAGQVGIGNGIEIGNGIVIAAKAGVTKNLKTPGQYGGFPAVPVKEWRRQTAYLSRLEELHDRVRKLESSKSEG